MSLQIADGLDRLDRAQPDLQFDAGLAMLFLVLEARPLDLDFPLFDFHLRTADVSRRPWPWPARPAECILMEPTE